MNSKQIVSNLSAFIDKHLVEDLILDYQEIKRHHFLEEYEHAINKSGKFVQTVFQILEYIRTGNVVTKPNHNEISKHLKNDTQLDETIRMTIPRSAKAIYDIRSKRGAAHKSDYVSPNIIDSEYVISTCDWILAEFLRLFHDDNVKEISVIVNSLVEKKLPIIEEFEEDVIVLSDISKKDQCLVILYHHHPKMVTTRNLSKWTNSSSQLVYKNIKKAVNDKWVYKKDNKCTLTKLGIKKVEEIISKCESL
jgi:hypothetical protein